MPNERSQDSAASEQSRRLAEQGRAERERQREAAEAIRVVNEDARNAAELLRQEALADLHATADTLESTVEHMQVVEDMRRELREIRDLNKLDAN